MPNSTPPDRDEPVATGAERAWVTGVRNGDLEAFERIFRTYNRQLYQFALGMLGSPDEAEDAVQGVFVAIWEQRARWTVHGSLRVYLFSATRNRVLQQFRSKRTRERLQPDVLASRSRFLADAYPPDAQFQYDDFAAALDRAVAALPRRTREAFLLTREHGLTYDQAAAAMGVSPKTVMTLIGRALATLRKAVGPFLLVLLSVR